MLVTGSLLFVSVSVYGRLYYGVWLAIFPVFAAVSAILAAVCGFKACSGWQEMGIIEHAVSVFYHFSNECYGGAYPDSGVTLDPSPV